ncbi:MAG: hypothetical protein IJR60_08455 [Eubacterium sp.]|nr:hypothetical protein [Eubacterium sp.]
MTADAKEEYKTAELSVNLAGGENSKEMQKANDAAKQLEPLKSRWMKFRTAAIVCYTLAIPAFAVNLFFWLKKPKKESENIRE